MNEDFNKYIAESKSQIIAVLDAFKIGHGDITHSAGPTVTLFEFRPAVGTRASKIVNLQNDFAIQLGVQSVRVIAPTERGTVGIEVPNKERMIINMMDMFYSDDFRDTDMELPLVLGRKSDCSVFTTDLAKLPHLLVAGATGMGKSVGLNVIISSLVNAKTPDELKLVLIDPKQVEFTIYEKLAKNYILKLYPDSAPIITDAQEAINMLDALCRQMDQRYTMLREVNAKNLPEYNAKAVMKLPYIVVIIDEFADLMLMSRQQRAVLEEYICRIAQKARAVGIHAIISTQRPSTEFVTGCVKANFPARIAFRTTTAVDSRVIIDRKGAETLTGKGDFLFYNGGDTIRAQCAYISTEEVSRMCDELCKEYADNEETLLPSIVTRHVDEIDWEREAEIMRNTIEYAKELERRNILKENNKEQYEKEEKEREARRNELRKFFYEDNTHYQTVIIPKNSKLA